MNKTAAWFTNLYTVILDFYYFVLSWVAIKSSFYRFRVTKKELKVISLQTKTLALKQENKWITTSLAFYLLIAFIPTVALFLVIVFLSAEVRSFVIGILTQLFSLINDASIVTTIEEIFNNFLGNFRGGGEIVLAAFAGISVVLGSVHIAAKGMNKIIQMANTLYGIRKGGSSFVKSYFLYVIFLLTAVAMLFTLFGISFVFTENADYIPVAIFSQFIVVIVFLYVLFTLLHLFTPSIKLTWRKVHGGAFVSSILVSLVFTVFIGLYSLLFAYTHIYGSIALIMSLSILLLWISRSIFIGFCINAVILNKIHGFNPSRDQGIIRIKKLKSITLKEDEK